MLQTAPTMSVSKWSGGAPKCLHGSDVEDLPELTSNEKTRLLVPFRHWALSQLVCLTTWKTGTRLDSFDVIHQNPHEYRDKEGGLIQREEDGSYHPIIPYLLCCADARYNRVSSKIGAVHTFRPEVNHVSARSRLSSSCVHVIITWRV